MVPPLGSRVTFSGAGRHPPALRYPGQPDTLLVREQGVLTAAIGVSLPDAARPTRGPALSPVFLAMRPQPFGWPAGQALAQLADGLKRREVGELRHYLYDGCVTLVAPTRLAAPSAGSSAQTRSRGS